MKNGNIDDTCKQGLSENKLLFQISQHSSTIQTAHLSTIRRGSRMSPNHTCPTQPSTHAPQPCTPQPCIPPAMHAPSHTCMPPAMHAPTMYTCPQPCTPPATHTPYHVHPLPTAPNGRLLPVNRLTHTSENIIYPQLRLRAITNSS